MDFKTITKKYRNNLIREALFNSAAWALFAAFSAMFICSFILWLSESKAVWISVTVFAAVLFTTTPTVYFFIYRPSEKYIARRIDKLGLEERIITMNEYINDDSYMAECQRNDAISALGKVKAERLYFSFSKIGTSLAIGSLILSVAMTFICGFVSKSAVFPGGRLPGELPKQYSVKYYAVNADYYDRFVNYFKITDGILTSEQAEEVENAGIVGEIIGAPDQLVDEGESADWVYALPDDDFVFVQWSDGDKNPERQDMQIMRDTVILALFRGAEDEAGNGLGGSSAEGDSPDEGDLPQEGLNGEDGGIPQPGGDSAAGSYSGANTKVYDNETDARGNVFEQAYLEALEKMAQNIELTEEEIEFINNYYSAIRR